MLTMLVLKTTVLLSASLVMAWMLRGGSARSRHRLWTLTFVLLLVLPVAPLVLPALPIPAPSARLHELARANVQLGDERVPADRTQPGSRRAAKQSAAIKEPARTGAIDRSPWPQPDAATVLVAGWIIGTLGALALLAGSLVRVRWLAASAREMTDAQWTETVRSMAARLDVRRPIRLLMSDRIQTPMAGGLYAHTVYLASGADAWDDERRTMVLAHEVAHVASADPLRHIAARLAVAVYWFHPLAWIAARQASVAREEACDEQVLELGTRPSAYARLLLDLVDGAGPSASPATVLPIVERSLLERRLMAILAHRTPRDRYRTRLFPLAGLALVAFPVAAAQPATPVTVDGTVALPLADSAVAGRSLRQTATVDTPAVHLTPSQSPGGEVCASGFLHGSFSGSMSTSDAGGDATVTQQVGRSDGDRIVLRRFGDLRVCVAAEGVGESSDEASLPSEWTTRARRVTMETRRGTAVQRLVIDRSSGGAARTTWTVGSAIRPMDRSADEWRDRVLEVADTTWKLSSLHGRVSSLRGEISSIRGEESSLRGEISSLRGEVSSMRGRQSSIRGDESSLRGEISSIEGQLSSLRGEISSEQGSISSLNSSRFEANADDRRRIDAEIEKHHAEIARIEQEIRDYDEQAKVAAVEQRIKDLDADGQVAKIDEAIRAFNLDGKVAAIEAKISALDVDGKTAAIEQQIRALDADRRGHELEDALDRQVAALRAAVDRIR